MLGAGKKIPPVEELAKLALPPNLARQPKESKTDQVRPCPYSYKPYFFRPNFGHRPNYPNLKMNKK